VGVGGCGHWPKPPLPNPQSPIPNPHNSSLFIIKYILLNIISKIKFKFINNKLLIIIVKKGINSHNNKISDI
jgi:hypothetical protein